MAESRQKQPYTEARKRANEKWNAANTKVLSFKMMCQSDADVIAHVEKQPHKAEYFRRLIREDIAREEKNMEQKYWYAVQRSAEDDWGYGSHDRAEAMQMLRKEREDYPDALIAVIEEGDNPVCVEEIRELDE